MSDWPSKNSSIRPYTIALLPRYFTIIWSLYINRGVVDIMHNGSIIGTGLLSSVSYYNLYFIIYLLQISADDFSKVILKNKKRGIMDPINLYELVEGKQYFADLKVRSS